MTKGLVEGDFKMLSTTTRQTLVQPDRASDILARSIFRELKVHGYSRHQILSIAGELISAVTTDIQDTHAIGSD